LDETDPKDAVPDETVPNETVPDETVKGSPERREQIIGAAFALLIEKGYHRTSTLAIAQRAHTSKETIYNWFGSKEGLFRELVGSRAARMNADLQEGMRGGGLPVEAVLTRLGVNLLGLLLSEHAIAVNRAAIAEAHAHPELGRILYERGRGETSRLVGEYMGRKAADGTLAIDDIARAMDVFYGMLVGGLQWRRLLNLMPAPTPEFLEQRARETTDLFLRLYAAPPR
jgi:AcrR family transcriptional regulator